MCLLQTRSRQYNADIEVHTVRYAMLEQLRHPPKGTSLINTFCVLKVLELRVIGLCVMHERRVHMHNVGRVK